MTRTQAEFIKSSLFRKFGDKYITNKPNDFPVVEEMLLKAGQEFNDLVVRNLQRTGKVNTGKLGELGFPEVNFTNKGIVLSIGYPLNSEQVKYYDFVNKGVEGAKSPSKPNAKKYKYRDKQPPVKPILLWLKSTRYLIKPNVKQGITKAERKRLSVTKMVDDAKRKKSLAFAISKNIQNKGLKASYYFDAAVKQVFNKDFVEALSVAIGGDITLQFNSYGDNNSK